VNCFTPRHHEIGNVARRRARVAPQDEARGPRDVVDRLSAKPALYLPFEAAGLANVATLSDLAEDAGARVGVVNEIAHRKNLNVP
jgi:hypothetical protein